MRSVAAWLISLALCCAYGASVGSHATGSSLTLVFHFESSYSDRSFQEMKHELGSILRNSGIDLNWRDRNQLSSSDSFPNLVVVNFRGKCQMDTIARSVDALGPLALTHSSGGVVLPFSEVECDRVRSSLQRAMSGDDYTRSDLLLGRALARVLAHELYHVLASTESHVRKGVAQPALSAEDLIADQLQFNDAELDRMRRLTAGSISRR
jgi:hypothetical protein